MVLSLLFYIIVLFCSHYDHVTRGRGSLFYADRLLVCQILWLRVFTTEDFYDYLQTIWPSSKYKWGSDLMEGRKYVLVYLFIYLFLPSCLLFSLSFGWYVCCDMHVSLYFNLSVQKVPETFLSCLVSVCLLVFHFFFFFLLFLRRCTVCCCFFNLGMTVGSYSRALGWTLMFMNVFQFSTTMYMWKIHYVVILYLTVRKSNNFYTSDGYECKNDFPGLNFINLLSTKEDLLPLT